MTEQLLTSGLLNWYPFKVGESITFIGDYTEEFKEDILRRGVIEKSLPPYDYIIAVRAIEETDSPIEILRKLKGDLAEKGHLFLACENRFGLSYFAGEHDPYTMRVMDGIENYPGMTEQNKKNTKGRCYARFELESFLHDAGFMSYHGYSILPGLMMPQQIYHWDCLPNENIEVRYTALYQHPESVFLDTAKVYDSLVKNGMFHQMANAYLIDCCDGDDFFVAKYVTTSMDRGKENSTATVICGNDMVHKFALYPEGAARIENLCENMKQLQERNIPTVPMQSDLIATGAADESRIYNNILLSGCVMPYISAPTGLEYLRDLASRDTDAFIEKTCEFLDLILASSCEIPSEDGEGLAPLYEKAYIDMMPLNSFYKDGSFLFFDQEFCEEKYPIGIVLARALSIIYMGDKRLEERVPIAYFAKRYGINQKLNIYREKGDKYIQKLRNRQNLISYNSKHLLDYTTVEVNKQRINYSVDEYNRRFINLIDDISGKRIFVFGSGMWAKKFIAEYADAIEVEALLDNNENEHGKCIDGVNVKSPDILNDIDPDSYKVFICIKQYSAVLAQLFDVGVKHYGIYNPNVERPAIERRLANANNTDNVENSYNTNKKYHIGYIAGVFDLFHIGHLNLLRRAKEQCDYLIVGVVSDEQASHGKAHAPYISQNERREIVDSCKYVDETFILPPSASGTRDVFRKHHFDVQFSGSDYEHDPEWLLEQAWLRDRGANMVFFPYTKSTSSTKLKEAIERDKN